MTNWGSLATLGNEEDGDLPMKASRPSCLAYCYLDGDPYVSGEGSLSGGVGTQGQVKLWVLGTDIFSSNTVNKIRFYSPGFDCIFCINLVSTA